MAKKKTTKQPLPWKKYLLIGTLSAVIAVSGLVLLKIARESVEGPDTQCSSIHQTTTKPPQELATAMDYFLLGDYDYDTGDCTKAITDYTKAIELNPTFPESYNNRGYTYMRLREYALALPDLDKAIELRPHYVNALMNRGDIYNYYYTINRQKALDDYNTVLSLGKGAYQNTSLCGHRILAIHNGWNLGTIIDILRQIPEPMGPCQK